MHTSVFCLCLDNSGYIDVVWRTWWGLVCNVSLDAESGRFGILDHVQHKSATGCRSRRLRGAEDVVDMLLKIEDVFQVESPERPTDFLLLDKRGPNTLHLPPV